MSLLTLTIVSVPASGQELAEKTPPASAQETEKPNVLFIFADDQCFDTIAELGNPEVITPNLDRLAREGASFSNAYNMGGWNGAICVASRTMMNTGRFIWRSHALDSKDALMREAEANRTIPQLMRQAGYETFVSGKWHVKIDAEKLFDHVQHIRPGMPKDTPSSYSRPNDKGDWSPYDESLGGYWAGGKHWSEVLADDADTFLKQSAGSEQPFYMYLAFNAPHDPRQAPQKFVDMYDQDKVSIPENFMPQNPHMEDMDAGKNLRDEKLAPWPRTHDAVRLHRKEYYALITHMDAQIGRMLATLEATGQRDNTYIVFTADHGLACGQHGLLGKQSMYEHSMKAPLIVVGPGIPAAKRIDTPVYVQDLVATALELAQVDQPDYVEFKSLLPLIHDQRETQYDAIYGAYKEGKQRMIRAGGFKLIHYPVGDHYLLFNLEQDPHELHDLSESEEHAERREQLRKQLSQLMLDMDDPMLRSDDDNK